MSTPERTSVPPWLVTLVLALVVGLLWVMTVARGANAESSRNASLLMTPDLDVALVPGGPERFAERFGEAREDAELEATVEDLRWATLIVGNEGFSEAEDVTATAILGAELDPVLLADLASFGDLGTEEGEEGSVLDLGDVGEDERALVFLGFDPAALPAPLADAWSTTYRGTVDTIEVLAGDEAATVYGGAL